MAKQHVEEKSSHDAFENVQFSGPFTDRERSVLLEAIEAIGHPRGGAGQSEETALRWRCACWLDKGRKVFSVDCPAYPKRLLASSVRWMALKIVAVVPLINGSGGML